MRKSRDNRKYDRIVDRISENVDVRGSQETIERNSLDFLFSLLEVQRGSQETIESTTFRRLSSPVSGSTEEVKRQ